jgi:hypothetical protein
MRTTTSHVRNNTGLQAMSETSNSSFATWRATVQFSYSRCIFYIFHAGSKTFNGRPNFLGYFNDTVRIAVDLPNSVQTNIIFLGARFIAPFESGIFKHLLIPIARYYSRDSENTGYLLPSNYVPDIYL